MKRRIALCIAVSLCAGVYAGNNPGIYKKGWIDFNKNGVKDIYEDPSAPIEARVQDLLSQMTLEEKTCQMATLYGSGRVLKDSLPTEKWKDEIWKDGIANIDEQANGLGRFGSSLSYPYVNSVENRQTIQRWFVEQTRLGIPVDFTNEGIRGLCHDRATMFPAQCGQGATWNKELISEIAQVTAEEAKALGYTNIYSPILDIAQDPRWGRVVECYGEDPFLVGELGKRMIKGLQQEGLVATPKHFAVYSIPVGGRDAGTRTDPHVAPREMRTLYIEPFRKAFCEAGALGVMSSYNDYDGEPITGSYHFLTEILRHEWGFKGYVVSDSEAVEFLYSKHQVAADAVDGAAQVVNAGLNVRTNFTLPENFIRPLRQAISEGNKYIGWAYFHRAYRYLSLVFMFKDVPLVTKIIEGPKFDYKTTSREAILAKMVEDMEFAVQWVPEQKDMKEIGLVNKGACRMLLSKLYLATGQWEKAIQQLNEVIDNSGYSLMTNTFGTFVTPFNTETWPIQRNVIWDLHRPENKLIAENKEVILGMPNRGIGSSNSFVAFNTMRALGPLWDDKSNLLDPNGVQAVKSFARSDKNYDSKYDYNRSIGRGTGYLHPTYYSQYGMWEVNGVDDEGDLRRSTKSGNWMMMDSVRVNNPSSKYYGQYLQKSWCKDTIRDWFGWPHYKIYLMDQNAEAKESSTQFNGASSSSTTSGIADWYCYRLAEAYLLRAEAKFYNGDPAGAALDVNKVRERAQCKQLYTTVTIGDIMDERARELYLEEWRYLELSRVSYCLALSGKPDEWGNTYDVNTYDKQEGTDPNGGSYWYQRIMHYNEFYNKNPELIVKNHKYTIDKRNLYLPIPQSAIDANRLGKLRQNYGYDKYDDSVPMWGNWQEAVADEDNLSN